MIETELPERRPRTIHAATAGIREQLIADGRLVPLEAHEQLTAVSAPARAVFRIGDGKHYRWGGRVEAAERGDACAPDEDFV